MSFFPRQKPPQRLALIFPPAMHPTSPPLGISALAPYLAAEQPKVTVRTFDLNLAFFDQVLAWMKDGRLKVALKGWSQQETARQVEQAISFIKGEQGLEVFLELERYQQQALIYQRFEGVISGLFDNFARKRCLGMALPPLVNEFLAELLRPVLEFKPDLAGFSLLFSQQLYHSLALGGLLKERGVKVLLGGATLSVMPRPESLLAEPIPVMLGGQRHMLKASGLTDALLVGEGELGLGALLRNQPEEQTPGLVYLENDKVRHTPARMIEDLASLPAPDFSGLPLERYHSPRLVLPYLSARGCFWGRCTFCTHQKTYLAYREEPVERSIDNLALLKERHQTSHFALVDEMVHPKRMTKLARGLIAKELDLRLAAYAKPTSGFSPDILQNAHQAGLRLVMWGVESGSKRVLDLMAKGTNPSDMGQVLNRAHRAGIWNLVFAMFGFPGESAQEWEQTLSFLEEHGQAIDGLSKSLFLLLAGSRIMDDPQAHGLSQVSDRPWRDPIQIAYDYQAKQGLSQKEAAAHYEKSRQRLNSLGRSRYFGLFRDHMLIYAGAQAGPQGG